MPHKIGIYARVSTEEQAQVADGSIDSQQHRIRAFIDIKLHQDKDWGTVIETYIDDGYSAGSTNRPAYQRMIRDMKAGKINLILVADLSRLSRNISDFSQLYNEFGKYKASFLSIKEQFDTSTPVGEMMVFNMINLAQFERKQTAERISMNFHSRAMRGLANGGQPLLGYDTDPLNKGKRIVNEVEADLVKRIFEMYNEGQSLSSIADQLTKENIRRKEGHSMNLRHIKEGRWTIDSIQNLLKNHAYIGIRVVNAKNKDEDPSRLKAYQQYHLVPASWSAIIDEKLFSKVQKRLEEAHASERKRHHNGDRRPFLISGIIKCGHCGRALSGQSAHGNTTIHRYYGHKQLIGEKVTCPIKRFPANEIEEAVIQHLDRVLEEQGYLDKINDNIQKGYGASRSTIKMKKDSLVKAVQKIDGEIESIFRLVTTMKEGSAGAGLIQDKLQKLAEKKESLEQELEVAIQFEKNSSVVSGGQKIY
jgi:site-specific DNA recombinase